MFLGEKTKTCFEDTIEIFVKGYCSKMYQNIFTISSGGILKHIFKLLENLKHIVTQNLNASDTHYVDFLKNYQLFKESKIASSENVETNSAPHQQDEAGKVGGKGSKVSATA